MNFYSYKDHARSDADTVFITDYVVTDAVVHDSQVQSQLLERDDGGKTRWADSAYKSAQTDRQLKEWKIDDQNHEKAARAPFDQGTADSQQAEIEYPLPGLAHLRSY